jgi:hypothetical protein
MVIPHIMNPHGEATYTQKRGFFQQRGGFGAMAGYRGHYYRAGKPTVEVSDKNRTQVKKTLVPDDQHRTTKQAAVDKKADTVKPEGTNEPVVAEG